MAGDQKEVAVPAEQDADHREHERDAVQRARGGEDRDRCDDDGDLEQRFGEVEVGILGLVPVSLMLQLLGVLLDVLLLGVVALLLIGELRPQLLVLGPRRRWHGRPSLCQLGFEAEGLRSVLVLADDLGLVEGPLV
jgi:hypothetical protein